jgi:hypothetical protein
MASQASNPNVGESSNRLVLQKKGIGKMNGLRNQNQKHANVAEVAIGMDKHPAAPAKGEPRMINKGHRNPAMSFPDP